MVEDLFLATALLAAEIFDYTLSVIVSLEETLSVSAGRILSHRRTIACYWVHPEAASVHAQEEEGTAVAAAAA